VVGYPYGGALSGLNVTRGSVSSLKGLGGDATRLQITAPVQQGNSGGPLVAADGEIVGVIVSKLDVLKFADAIGDVPQNVNFAVRGEIAKLFLSQNGITPALSLDDIALDPTEIAERTAAFTVFIECH
jgi:S1-C subfamily serine protease